MKRTVKITSIVLSAVLAFSVFTGFSVDSKADSKQYHLVIGEQDFGEHPIYENQSDAVSYVLDNIMARNEQFSFYFASSEISSLTTYCKDFVNQAIAYRADQSSGGDYLAKAYSGYTFHYFTFANAYEGRNLFKVDYNFGYYTTAEEEKAVDSKVHQIINSLNIGAKSDLDKLTAIYNWITANIKYDYENSTLPRDSRNSKTYTAYNALFGGKAVCQGVASLFYKMLLTTGIENRIVYWDNHCWNIVNINNTYYNCDVTWDLGVAPSAYTNFLRGKETSFKGEHKYYNNDLFLGYAVADDDYNAAPATPEAPVTTTAPAATETKPQTQSQTNKPSQNVLDFATRLYTVVLGRDAEEDGLNYWATELAANRLDGASAARSFINSDEFKGKNVNNTEYLGVLYSTFFNREMDDGGRDYWLSVLKSGTSREEVLEGFVNSEEWIGVCASYGIKSGACVSNTTSTASNKIDGFAERLYTTVLNRSAEQSGLNYWSNALASKSVTGTAAAYSFVFSDEFVGANVSNGEFINRLYKLFMDRDADQGGYDYWMGRFASGATREDVFFGFSTSEEFGKICDSYGIAR